MRQVLRSKYTPASPPDLPVCCFTVILPDGTRYNANEFGANGTASSRKDSNGNTATRPLDTLNRNPLTSSNGPNMSYTTPLGVTLLGPQYTNYTTIDTNGATRIFRVDYTAIDVRTSFCGGAPCDYGSTSPVGWLVPSSLTLPNPNAIQKYQFSWFNQSGAELQQVTLPSGGTISYTYGNRCLQEKPVSN